MTRLYLRFLSFSLVLMMIMISYQSCSNSSDSGSGQQDEYKNIARYFHKEHNLTLSDDIHKIFVITENGCPSCNVKFARQISDGLNDKHSLFLLAASGALVDISGYTGKPNVYQDQQIDDLEYPIFLHSKVIYLSRGQIDTIVNIEARELKTALEIVKTR